MPRTSYPTAADVEGLLKSSSFWPTDPTKQEFARLQCEIGASSAAEEFEKDVSCSPFLPTSTAAQEREFTEIDHNGRIEFRACAVEIESVTVNGIVLPLGYNGYRALPQNARSMKQPITAIELGRHGHCGKAHSYPYPVIVKAIWGYSTYCPSDAWQAIQQKAALIALTQIENLQNVASISEDGFTKAYDVVGVVTQKDLVTLVWGKSFDAAVRRYAREVVF